MVQLSAVIPVSVVIPVSAVIPAQAGICLARSNGSPAKPPKKKPYLLLLGHGKASPYLIDSGAGKPAAFPAIAIRAEVHIKLATDGKLALADRPIQTRNRCKYRHGRPRHSPAG